MFCRFKNNRLFGCGRKFLTTLLLAVLLFSDLVPMLILTHPHQTAEAVEVTIDAQASGNQNEHTQAGHNAVFIDDQTGYKFYIEADGRCVYKKTTNGGASWGSEVDVHDDTSCASPTVWYDQWTPGDDSGEYIHISMLNSAGGSENITYNRLDTSDDSLLLPTTAVDVSSSTSNSLSLTQNANKQAITKGTDGTLYIALADNAGSFVVECSSSCQAFSNWTETGTTPIENQNSDWPLLVPLSGGNIMLIVRDISADTVESQIWNNVVWSGAWATIDDDAVESTAYDVGMSAVAHPERTDEVYLVYTADNGTLGTDDDIRTAKYSEGSWSNTTDILTDDSKGILQVSMVIDENTDLVYVTYSARTTPGTANTANVYWSTSTLAMNSWGAEQGPVNTGGDNNYGISANYFSDERMYVTWYDDATRDVFGETLFDTAPITVVSATGTQRTEARASTSDVYLGGSFVITENIESRDVTDITLTEQGSVDGSTGISDIELRYDLDTTAPYDCSSESYGGSESQFGATDINGFSGADGTASFSDIVSISPTQTLCLYPILTIEKATADGETIDVVITNSASDITVTGGVSAIPTSVITINGVTTIRDDDLTQTHYHWRNDDGSETAASSATGGSEDTALVALQSENPRRLRFGLSNEGGTTTFATTFRLEYGEAAPNCSDIVSWTDVGATDDAWNMSPSANLTDGADTTDVAVGNGGVSGENTFFVSPNSGVRDTNSETGSLQIDDDEYTALEFSIVASTTATEGTTYCFRLSDQGEPLETYDVFPEVTISADVDVRVTGTQITSADIPAENLYVGGTFSIGENVGSRNVTSITITETGTVDATAGLEDIRLYYDLDTSLPYNCASESFNGTEPQFGATSTAFSAANGSSTFTGSVGITTTQTMCVYAVLDVTGAASNGETINLTVASPTTDVVVSGGGTVSPSSVLDLTGSTTLNGAIVTQTHYHWRNDDGSETTASSATGDEDLPLEDFDSNQTIRLRFGLSNEGATTSIERRYGIEYGINITTCSDISVWTDIAATTDAWDMFDSANLTNGETTTNISTTTGGVSDENNEFLSSNSGVRDTESFSASTTLQNDEHVDLEYSITSTADTLFETTYCFRLTQNGEPLIAYTIYPELTTAPKRDFRIQHGTTTVTGSATTITAGADYTAPAASSSAFIRLTSAHHTGAGRDDSGGNQNSDDYSVYIQNPENIETSITFARDSDSVNNSLVTWEIVEFVGDPGTDNEMIVRDHGTVTYGSADTVATGTAVATITDDSDVVIFITGQTHTGGNRTEAYAHQSTSEWSAATDEPVFQRGATGGNTGSISYAVVEFTGINWRVQRAEHAYQEAGVTETEDITAVTSLSQTFLHTQKRHGVDVSIDDFGHLVWLSSIGAVSFELAATAATTTNHVGVAWVIENTQTSQGGMSVQRQVSSISGGSDVQTNTIGILSPVAAVNNTSLFAVTRHNQTGNNMPRPLAGFTLVATTTYEIYRSESAGTLSYRTEIVEWPVANISVRQNYYRFYVDDNNLDPTDPWPLGASDLGENTSITALDEPLGEGERVRIRMSATIGNANLPAGLLSVKLQFGERVTSCSAVATWEDVGQTASSTLWRGFDATGITDGVSLSGDPPTVGDLNLAVSDVSGSYIEENPSPANPFEVQDGEDIEYDWIVEHNGAQGSTFYCFRMVNSDGTPLDGYFNYPELRTAGFTPVALNWRWYGDEENETPSSPLANEVVAPTGVANGNSIALRLTVGELKNVSGNNTKFKLQFSEAADFSTVTDVAASSSCAADSIWCYADGGGVNNSLISSSTLSDADSCVAGSGDGCGTHNESADLVTGDIHPAGASREYSFIIQHAGARANAVYYFRAFDVTNDNPLIASSSNPSLVTEGAQLTFTVSGLELGTTTEGVVTDVTTAPAAIAFGSLPLDTEIEAAQRIRVDTNATEGYQVLLFGTQHLTNSYGTTIAPVTGSNGAPSGWGSGCSGTAEGCFGYHAGDDILSGGSTRFSPDDSYATLSGTPEEILYSSVPVNELHDVVYKLQVRNQQPAGVYEADVVYIVVPVH
ncbi:MAG: hypothetical protein AAGA35_00045 [Patescibacteria group bacterium]